MMENFRVWVGCLGCYNAGTLVGEWWDAIEAPTSVEEFDESVKVPAVHIVEGHEELWCFDTEWAPIDGEISPSTAREWAEALKDITDADEYETFRQWLDDGADTSQPWHAVDTFADSFQGVWNSPEEFIEELLTDLGEMPESLRNYIDWEHITRDYMMDYSAYEVVGGYGIVRD